jgi:hypothetical protein
VEPMRRLDIRGERETPSASQARKWMACFSDVLMMNRPSKEDTKRTKESRCEEFLDWSPFNTSVVRIETE